MKLVLLKNTDAGFQARNLFSHIRKNNFPISHQTQFIPGDFLYAFVGIQSLDVGLKALIFLLQRGCLIDQLLVLLLIGPDLIPLRYQDNRLLERVEKQM